MIDQLEFVGAVGDIVAVMGDPRELDGLYVRDRLQKRFKCAIDPNRVCAQLERRGYRETFKGPRGTWMFAK